LQNRDVRDFLFRGLMFESEADSFRRAGIQIGSAEASIGEDLLKESLAPFGILRRDQSLQMSRLYAVLYCFENELRDFVRQALEEKDGAEWVDKLPPKVSQQANARKEAALKDSWLEGEKTDVLGFADFGHLAQIIIHRWEVFESIVPSQHWLKQRMDELEKVRNFIAHNRMLLESEFQRTYMYISDWNKVIGL
jgi:Swt1-like HEPN